MGFGALLRGRHLPLRHRRAGCRRRQGRRAGHHAGRDGQPYRRARQPARSRRARPVARRRRRRHQHRHHHPGPDSRQRPLRHRDLHPPRLLCRGAGARQDEDQRRLRRGQTRPDEGTRREPGHGSGSGRADGGRSRPQRPDRNRRRSHRRDRGPLRRNRTARVLLDHRCPWRRRSVPQRRCLRTAFRRRLPGGLAAARWPAGPQLRPAAPGPSARRPRPGGTPAGGDGLTCPSGDIRADTEQPGNSESVAERDSAVGGDLRGLGRDGLPQAVAEAGGRPRGLRHHPGAGRRRLERRRYAVSRSPRSCASEGMGVRPATGPGRRQNREGRLLPRSDHHRCRQRHRYQRTGRRSVGTTQRHGIRHRCCRQRR